MALEDDIRASIDANLTGEVGSILKERLQQAEDDSKNLIGARSQITDLQANVRELESKLRQYSDTEAREAALDGRERELEIKDAVMEEREKHVNARVSELRGVMDVVFKGPASQLAFNANLYGNVQTPMGSYSANLSGDVDQKAT